MFKNKIVLGIMSLAFFAACSNNEDSEVTKQSELVNVKFNVKSLDVDVEPMGGNANSRKAPTTRAASSPGDALHTIHYALMKVGSYQVITGEQTKASAGDDFGTIQLTVAPGDYNIFFVATGANPAKDASLTFNWDETYTSATGFTMRNQEIFTYHERSMIDNTNTSFDVEVERLVGKLVVNLTDEELQGDIEKVKVSYEYLPQYLFYSDESRKDKWGNYGSVDTEIEFKDGHFSEHAKFITPQNGIVVTLTTYDINEQEIASTSVTCNIYKNRRTIISGKLFDVLNNRNFTITVVDEWGNDVNVPLG